MLFRRCRRLQHRNSLTPQFGRNTTNIPNEAWGGIPRNRCHHQHRFRCTLTRSRILPPTSYCGRYDISFLSPPENQKRRSLWWNPFSKSGVRDNNAIVGSTRTKTESEEEEPRKILERKDLTLLMLALEFHKISVEEDRQKKEEVEKGDYQEPDSLSSVNHYLQNREKMIDSAFSRLEEMEIDKKSMMQLRYALQEALEEQVKVLLESFASIDEELLLLVPDSADARTSNDINIESYLEETLGLELERTIDELANSNRSRAPKGANPIDFLQLKRGAIERLLSSRRDERHRKQTPDELSDNTISVSTPKSEKDSDGEDQPRPSWSEADEFGYHESIDQERNRLIRYYQSINLCRSAKMRDEIGYSVVALQSSIPGAGRGVYVDGYARAGSILAFQPGPVWAKEHLANLSIDEERDLERNDSYQMSLRADDYMIDSRRSPYTVLTDEKSNLMAVGHIVNHPSPTNPPSCRSAMLNFTKEMIGSSPELERYIPNTYARPRNVTLMDSLWDRDVIEMHSLVLVATRDICNEEIFYDYRLASSHLPQWYHQVHDTAYEETEDVKVDDNNNEKI